MAEARPGPAVEGAVAAIPPSSGTPVAGEAGPRERLEAGQNTGDLLRSELAAAKAQARDAEDRLARLVAAGRQSAASLEHDLDAARAQLSERVAAGESLVARLKQEHAGAAEKAAKDHEDEIARKNTFIDELKARVQQLAELEKRIAPAVAASASHAASPSGGAKARGFSGTVMAVVAALAGGASGVGGYVYRGDAAGDAGKLNRDLQAALQSERDAAGRLTQDLKTARDQLRTNAAQSAGAADVSRQLADMRSTNDGMQQRLAALETELGQSRQAIATRDQAITQLTGELQDARARTANAGDPKPRPGQSIDIDATIKSLQRDFGIPIIRR